VIGGGLTLFFLGSPQLEDRLDIPVLVFGLVLGGLLAVQLGVLVSLLLSPGRFAGSAVTRLGLGWGPVLTVRRLGGIGLAVHAVPLMLTCSEAIVDVSALRPRLLIGGLLRAAVPGGLGAALLSTGTAPLWQLGMGTLFIALLLLISGPRSQGTIAWLIFTAPFSRAALVPETALRPCELAACRALLSGRVGDAQRALAGHPAETPGGVTVRAEADVAAGDYDRAVVALVNEPEEGAFTVTAPGSLPVLIRAWLLTAEAYPERRDDALAAARVGITASEEGVPGFLARTDLPATNALLRGRPQEALALATQVLRQTAHALDRAYTLCTIAAAQTVTGDQPAARASLAQARAIAPELARIATVERLIAELTLTHDAPDHT
jgi:hypothetical protein